MTTITKKEVEHIAKLARLELTEKEIEKMQKDLSEILDYFNLLKKVADGKGHIEKLKKEKSTRQDTAKPQPEKVVKKLVAAVPNKKNDYIKVKVIL